ncbi:MAG TPA: tRNA pseudouridine(55) synthase TruB [Terriglobales bacterium]|nr:tRNA pseudouridine(55) synthase TruB [Terriglobales bacterium]
MDGALIVDKPAGMTSHDVVLRVRRLTGERSIGHLGTLDPAATGVLPLLLGRMTRLARFFQDREKEYEGEIIFGQATSTFDAKGEPVGPVLPPPDPRAVDAALPALRGAILQSPPSFSAKKIAGKRAYELARRRQPVELKPVEVRVHEFTILGWEGPKAHVRVRCSTGTYVRSLAHELGRAAGSAAHLGALRRTRVGEFTTARSHTLEALGAIQTGDWASALVPPRELLPEFPAVVAPPEAAAKLAQGRTANLPEFSASPLVRVFTPDERLLAIARRVAGSLFQPEIVFPR